MPSNVLKRDLRTMKTNKALTEALPTLLGRQNFLQITVNDLCSEALVSRATFYAHFNDKYDLLEYWLADLKQKNIFKDNTCEQTKMIVNKCTKENKLIIRNLFGNANAETIKILCKHLLSILNIYVEEDDNEGINPQDVVLYNFCAGGIIYYLNWQIENKFPSDMQVMNSYFFDLVQHLQKWNPS